MATTKQATNPAVVAGAIAKADQAEKKTLTLAKPAQVPHNTPAADAGEDATMTAKSEAKQDGKTDTNKAQETSHKPVWEAPDGAAPSPAPAAPVAASDAPATAPDSLEALLAEKAKREQEAQELEAKISAIVNAEKNKEIEAIRAKIVQFKIDALDLFPNLHIAAAPSRGRPRMSSAGPDDRRRASPAPKYKNNATQETWSGRGLQPRWLKAALAAGAKLEDFLI